MQLADDDALGAVDDESALGRHEREFAHVYALFLDVLVFAETEGDVEGSGEGLTFANAIEKADLGFTDFVFGKFKLDLFVVTFDRKNFVKNGLQSLIFPAVGSDLLLQKIAVGVALNLDEVGHFNRFLQFAKRDAFHGV